MLLLHLLTPLRLVRVENLLRTFTINLVIFNSDNGRRARAISQAMRVEGGVDGGETFAYIALRFAKLELQLHVTIQP